MAFYACSDLHGRYDKYIELLEHIRLGENDTLFILGDMVDRGPGGLRILRDATARPNVVPLLGNHEFSAALCLSWLMKEVTEESTKDERGLMEHLEMLRAWQADGGDATLAEFRKLTSAEQRQVLDDLMELDTWAEVETGGQKFILLHTTPVHFAPDKPLDDYGIEDLLFSRPDLRREYYPDKILVIGHTPTCYLRCEEARDKEENSEQYSLDIFRKGDLIDLDCGCVFTGRLGYLRLDDMQEFYV